MTNTSFSFNARLFNVFHILIFTVVLKRYMEVMAFTNICGHLNLFLEHPQCVRLYLLILTQVHLARYEPFHI